jgi:hypothetical protein
MSARGGAWYDPDGDLEAPSGAASGSARRTPAARAVPSAPAPSPVHPSAGRVPADRDAGFARMVKGGPAPRRGMSGAAAVVALRKTLVSPSWSLRAFFVRTPRRDRRLAEAAVYCRALCRKQRRLRERRCPPADAGAS